jgi:hypothetical protein
MPPYVSQIRRLLYPLNVALRRVRWNFAYERMIKGALPRPDPLLRDLFNRYGIAFIHIPKNAGTSVEAALYRYSVKHRTWEEVRKYDPDGFAQWIKFAIVREPIDRFLSAYDYLLKGGRNEYDRNFSRRYLAPSGDINSFVAKLRDSTFRQKTLWYFHLRPQSEYVLSADRCCMVNYLVPLEKINDVPEILGAKWLSIPRLNATAGDRTKRECLTRESVKTLHEIYAADFALYRFAISTHGDAFGKVVSIL